MFLSINLCHTIRTNNQMARCVAEYAILNEENMFCIWFNSFGFL